MANLWGSKKEDNHESQPRSNAESSARAVPEEVDERTHLLPSLEPHDGYTSPDDPAVTPYNLWSVRFLHHLSVLFAALTFLWWVSLLVSIFVSPPGMHSRGSGFFDFAYATLTLGLLLVALLFFSTPSKATQSTCAAITVLLLSDTIIIFVVGKLRSEEGWVGIASVVWALFISIWVIMTDRVVTWGKHEEEERLTGHIETRRTVLEWVSVLLSVLFFCIFALVAFLLTATLILRAHDASLAAPGERYFVDGDKYQIHLFCEGNSNSSASNDKVLPTVLFEAGDHPFGQSMIQIAANCLANGTISRYCYSDRPGFGWSDNAPSPFSAGMGADVLSEALARAGEDGPWILVSAGVGSIYSRIFSARHGTDVKGLLMIDPLHEDLLHRIASPHGGFILWARGIISPLGLDRLPAALFKGRTREDRVFGRSSYQNGKYIKAKLQESLVADSLTKNEVSSARHIQLEDTPLVIVSSGIEIRRDTEWERKQRDLTRVTRNLLSWDIVKQAPSEVWQTLAGRTMIEKRLKELMNV